MIQKTLDMGNTQKRSKHGPEENLNAPEIFPTRSRGCGDADKITIDEEEERDPEAEELEVESESNEERPIGPKGGNCVN